MLWKMAITLFGSIFCLSASAQFTVCNKTASDIELVFNKKENGAWLSRGWYVFTPGECSYLISSPLQSRYYYYFARSSGNKTWRGEENSPVACIRDLSFVTKDEDCQGGNGRYVRLKTVDTGDNRSAIVNFTDPENSFPDVQVAEVQNKCIARWEDSHQVHSVRTIVNWNYQAVKTRMKKLEHCVRIRVNGPINIEGVAKQYVDHCINYGLNHQKVRHSLGLVAAIAGDIASGGATAGGLTAAKITDYVTSASNEIMDCLTNGNKINEFLGSKLKEKFNATVKSESHWVYWDL